MDSHAPWHNFQLYKRNVCNTSDFRTNQPESHDIKDTEQETILNEYRNKINTFEETLENHKNWEYYKKIVNPYEMVYTQKKYDNFPESICFLKPLSRSYFKMLEMLDLLNFFEIFKNEQIKTAHICEGPGGFIEAVYDRAVSNRKQIHSSVAMTLRSKLSNVPGWKRATQFLQKYRNIKIVYGHDETGNVLKPENQEEFIELQKGKVSLFTADGGFDFSVDYTKQEQMILPLLISSTRIGFDVLKRGGVFIVKIFDFYKKPTIDLIYLLSCHFSSWTLYKPATSRPCNPEHYFIGKDFLGASEKMMDYLRLWVHEAENGILHSSLFTESFSYSNQFLETIDGLRNTSFKKQIEYLEKVFNIIIDNNTEKIKYYLDRNQIISYKWCKKFKVPIYSSRCLAIEGLQNGQQVFFQQ